MKIILTILSIIHCSLSIAQDTVRYVGTAMSNVDYHHGQLSPAVGVHNIQPLEPIGNTPNGQVALAGHTTMHLCWLIGTIFFIWNI